MNPNNDALTAPHEPMARFCPGCGSVGEVPKDKFRDCCPDGARARKIPEELARQCHDLFRMAVDSATAVRPTPLTIAQIRDAALVDSWIFVNATVESLMKFTQAIERAHGIGSPGAPVVPTPTTPKAES